MVLHLAPRRGRVRDAGLRVARLAQGACMIAPAELLSMPDETFVRAWSDLGVDGRNALPIAVASEGRARYTELTSHVRATVERAQRGHHNAQDAPQRAQPEPLPGYPISAIWNGYSAPPYLVKRLLAPGELTVLFGQSGHFKSVVAVDLALSVGAGVDYHGMRARRAGVLYVAGEGHAGIRKRARAWLLSRDYNATSDQPHVYFTSAGADLVTNPDQLRATVEHAAATLGVSIELVIVDTLAASFGSGDENVARDMGLAIAGARTAAPGAAVLLVHHVGHGQAERERGSYALVAAADCRLQCSYDEGLRSVELRWHKLKDDERPEPMLFSWRGVDLDWQDEDGDELTSVVLERLEGGEMPRGSASTRPLGKNEDLAMRVLRTLLAKARKNLAEGGRDASAAHILMDGWRRALAERGMQRNRFAEVFKALQERGLIAVDGVAITPIEGAR